MNGFDRIWVRGFRRLGDFSMELRRLNVLIGANGCGKSSLLDVFSLLSAAAAGGLTRKISDMGGISSFATKAKDLANAQGMPQVVFQLSTALTENAIGPVVYDLALHSLGNYFRIGEERLVKQSSPEGPFMPFLESTGGKPRLAPRFGQAPIELTWDHEPLETVLSQVRDPSISPILELRRRLSPIVHYQSLWVDPRAPVRLPQPLRPATLPGRDGEDLASCLYGLRESNRDRFELVEDALKAAFPDFVRLEFPTVATGIIALAWRDRNFANPFYVHELSDGMIRFLWLATLLQCPDLPSVTLLDEPDVSLHPALMNLVVELLREASERTQLIIATQSDRFVRFLQPDEVVAFDLDEKGLARATRADQHDLEEWLKDYTLDQVWRLGLIGGRS